MSKTNLPLTDEEKFELALQTEQELARLTRTYTILERNRAEFLQTGGACGKLAKHKKVLDIFKKEQRNILTDLAVASAEAKIKDDEKLSKKLGYLLVECDEFDDDIKQEKNHTKEIEFQIQMMKKKALELSAKQISEDKHQQRIIKSEKTVQTLENKLEVQMKKFCAICSENRNLRYELQHLLNERNEFNKIWDKLIKNLCIGKKFMIDLIEQATIAYDQREEWVSKLQFLRSKAHNDLLAHIQDRRELQRKQDNDLKLQEFFAVKGQKRFMKDLESIQIKKREENKAIIEKKLEQYLEMLVMIKEFTNESNIPDIAKNFLNQEEENFAMFKYVNNLNKQMEGMSDILTQLYKDIDEEEVLQENRAKQQEDALKKLEKEVDEYTKKANKKEDELKTVEKKLNVILSGIETLFRLFRCSNDPIILMLGHNETIHYHNVLLYLQVLEKNIQDALVTVHYREKRNMKKKSGRSETYIVRQDIRPHMIYPIEKICNTSPCPLCIEHDLVSDVIDELQFAYTKSEIQEKLRTRLQIEGPETGLHNVSACHLPKSRQIIQKRYQ
ncbi:coiled-coil domain-containing protein 63-like [Rhynchophorus ferrugineus]|uniref:coiled-coil domain-containing protein 63-like n=1 Tax=Rhynchophorus ferrugineus TaxID=354439 RepID=UPI003FCC345B